MPDKRKKQEQVFIELVNLQLKPHGKTYEDVKGDPEWYMKYKTSRDSEKTFMSEGSELIRKKLGLTKKLAEKEMSWFVLQWGLTTVEAFENMKIATQITEDKK
jgi:hypothetical protein|tara:strand:+ start:86 stop:394 length:309 start_codon:yes stop_codon:yes gene_type:complete